jgi:hypothetical protein
VISRRALVSALSQRKVADWVVVERDQELAHASDAPLHRTEERTRWSLVVHHDVPRGRGTARLELGTRQGDARDIVDQALALASAAIGPPWTSPPAAAPAKVQIGDDKLAKGDLAPVASAILGEAKRPAGAAVQLAIDVMRERVTVQAESGFHTSWLATRLGLHALVAVGDHSLAVTRETRRRADLEAELGDAIGGAAGDLVMLGRAVPAVPGKVSVILRADALLHGGGLGMWNVFADHASAETERQGLTRYRQGAVVAPGADTISEPLTITSEGALDFAPLSAPVGDEGDAVRRFPLVERGIATGLGLSVREAARRNTDPNGGVRNLVVSRGTWNETRPEGRVIEVRRLRSLSIDPFTGDASLEIALGLERDAPFTGGTVRLDLIAALARARRSATTLRRGPYLGPSAVLIEGVDLA